MLRPEKAVLFWLGLVLGVVVALAPAAAPAGAQNTLVADVRPRYAVTWRTDTTVVAAVAEISVARPAPALRLNAEAVTANTTALETENGAAHHHSAVFTDLRPGTLYSYRVSGAGAWSEWFQFRTASTGFAPFSFLYFGDAQNEVKSLFSRTIRQAALDLPDARALVFAGDLVNLRDGNHDDEWGEWFDAGGWLHGMIPSVVAAGVPTRSPLVDIGPFGSKGMAFLFSVMRHARRAEAA